MLRWDAAEPLLLAAAVLLVVAGVPKVRDPAPLARAVASIGVSMPVGVARIFAVAEVVLGISTLLMPGPALARLVALFYAGFTAFVVVALVRGGLVESCGCLGKADTPPTVSHALVTGAFALAAAVAATAHPTAGHWWDRGLGTALAIAGLAGLTAFIGWIVLAVLPLVTPSAIHSIGRS